MGRIDVRICAARNLADTQWVSKPDPYCIVRIENQKHKTTVKENNLNPEWNEVFKFTVADENSAQLSVEIWNKNVVSDELMGSYQLSLTALQCGVVRDEWFLLQRSRSNAEIRLRLLAHDFGAPAGPQQQAQQLAQSTNGYPQQQQTSPQLPNPQQQQQQPTSAYPMPYQQVGGGCQAAPLPPQQQQGQQQPPPSAYPQPPQQAQYRPPVNPMPSYGPPQPNYSAYPPQNNHYPPQQSQYPQAQPYGGYPPPPSNYQPAPYQQASYGNYGQAAPQYGDGGFNGAPVTGIPLGYAGGAPQPSGAYNAAPPPGGFAPNTNNAYGAPPQQQGPYQGYPPPPSGYQAQQSW